MPPSKLVVNGTDLAGFGMWIDTPQGWADAPARNDRLVDLQAAGSAVIGSASRLAERRWTVTGMLSAATLDDAMDLWDLAKLHLSGPWLEIMVLPFTDRVAICRYQRITWQGLDSVTPGWRFTLEFLSPSPYLISPIVDPVGLTAGVDQPLTLGSAPCPYILEIQGPATNPSLIYYDAGGTRQGVIRFTKTLILHEWLRFDSQTLAMERHSDTGVVTNGAPYFANSSDLFQLDPADGTPDRGPSVYLDSGTAVLYVRKAWL